MSSDDKGPLRVQPTSRERKQLERSLRLANETEFRLLSLASDLFMAVFSAHQPFVLVLFFYFI